MLNGSAQFEHAVIAARELFASDLGISTVDYMPSVIEAFLYGEDADELIVDIEASADRTQRMALAKAVTSILESDEPTPPAVKKWLILVLRGERVIPRRKFGRPSKTKRDKKIFEVISHLCEEHAMTATRNEQYGPQPCAAGRSAIDAAGIALRDYGHFLAYSSLRTIWHNGRHRQRF